jgi:hypothetical protein
MSDITYATKIAQLECAASESGKQNVVKTVHWRVEATDGTYTSSAYGSLGLDPLDPKKFVAYDKLKESDVAGWVNTRLDIETLKAGLAENIALQANPPIVTPGLPWAS